MPLNQSLNQSYIRAGKDTHTDDMALFNKEVGRLLQKARVSASMSQEQVGKELNISQDAVSRHENGSVVSAFRLREFARLYEKPVSFFYMADIARH